MRRLQSTLASLVLLAAAVGLALVVCEVAVRVWDGQLLLALRLPEAAVAPQESVRQLDANIGGATLSADIDPEWINVSPPPLANRGPVDPLLAKRMQLPHGPSIRPFELLRMWNRRFVEMEACVPGSTIAQLPQPLSVFDSPEPGMQPPFRYPLARTLPGGLTTNHFGWRGPEIPLDKPPGTIRLAFVGASTTVGLWNIPFSYPEYVVHWLNLWAQRTGAAARFDGINAGREGLISTGIAAVVRQELLPAEPDLVVYYEGANQSLCAQAPGARPQVTGDLRAGIVARILDFTREHFQLARRVDDLVHRLDAHDGDEPAKPALSAQWAPADLLQGRPDLTRPDLPQPERVVLASLDAAREALEKDGGELAVSSFVWLVSDGLRLDPLRHLGIYRHLNEWCWRHRYADVRRALDLHNRILEEYAHMHRLPFIDVASVFPPDPDLFFDSIHLNEVGTRLHAWIVFRALVPLLRARLDAGVWPRSDRVALTQHPNIKPTQLFNPTCATMTPHAAPAPPTPAPRKDDRFL